LIKEIALKPNRQQPKLFFGAHIPLRRVLNLAILATIYPPSLLANPGGAHIINGQVSIDTSSPDVTTITNSPNAIIQWQNFNIAQNEITRFIQQNSQSAVLNRIIGENPSAILGQLVSNGKVLLINPNGIVFGANSVIDTQGLIASSLNLSNRDFLNGNYHFIAGSNTGNIVNEGIIRAGKNGNIILIAPSINNNGIIKTEGGKITLAAGQKLVLTNLDDPDIRFEIQAPQNAVLNLGKLLTEGGAINVFANTITHSGEINADSVTIDTQGNIKLVAQQHIDLTQDSKLSANNSFGDAGTITIESKEGAVAANGTIEAQATATGKGGNITVLGEQIGVLDQASIDAGGANGGGQVVIGGDNSHTAKAVYLGADTSVNADAVSSGNGGNVRVWSDNGTLAYGHISAKGGEQDGNGGVIETSGHRLNTAGIQVDASANNGKGGEWRLDSDNINIQAKGVVTVNGNKPSTTTEPPSGIVTAGSIQSALNTGTSVTVNTDTAGINANGDITVASAIIKNAGGDAALNLNARNNITLNASVVSNAGKLDIALTPNSDARGGGITAVNKAVDLNTGTLTLNGESTTSASGTIKNGALIIPDSAKTELNGALSNVNTVNINKGAQLTISRLSPWNTDGFINVNIDKDAQLTINRGNADFKGLIKNSGTLVINAYFAVNSLDLDGGLLTGLGSVKVNDRFVFHSGILDGTAPFVTAAGSTTTLADVGTAYLGRQWNNFGTINWQGLAAFRPYGDNSILNNGIGGIFNIGSLTKTSDSVLEINTAEFNNHDTLNLSGGLLKIFSPGSDTGTYNVSGNGRLQFWDGTRNFHDGAALNSVNDVTFVNGTDYFNHGTSYSAAGTLIDNATVAFVTGNTITMSMLTIDNNGKLSGTDAIQISNLFNFYSGFLGGGGMLTTPANSTTTLTEGIALLNRNWDNYGTVNFGVTNLSALARTAETEPPIRHWNNYGTILWQGAPGSTSDLGKNIILTNMQGGLFNISNDDPSSARGINIGAFNNHGALNLSGGILNIFSPGTDTGSYNVTGTGQLQFRDGTRTFSGAHIDSANSVSFIGSTNHFNNGAVYNAPETLIDGATINFNTAASLEHLVMSGGLLNNTNSLSVKGTFDWSGGILSGNGAFHFGNGFNYTEGTMLTTGSVTINDYSGSLSLPAMPSINRLNAYSSGHITLNGDITANGNATAIALTAGTHFDNSANAVLSAPHGRWLVYSDNPGENTLGGLTADFKHYGCNTEACNDGFNLPTDGNGLMYYIAPVLVVTPDTLSSTYGNHTTFSSAYTGFIDGDSAATAGIKGAAGYSSNATTSSSGNYNAGTHNVAYTGGLTNTLGYQIQDDKTSTGEWTITPRDLSITADALSKAYGQHDPVFTYKANGLISGDTLNGALRRSTGEDVGYYAITQGSLTAGPNYTISYTADYLTIASLNLSVTADAFSKVYGEHDPLFTYKVSGLINGDTLHGTLSRILGEDVGRYTITQGSLAAGPNYTIDYTAADLTITPRDLNIMANALSKIHGEHDPIFTYNASGLINGDTLSGTLSRILGEDAGRYAITQGGLTAGPNYTIDYTPADLTIKPEPNPIPPENPVQQQINNQQNQVLVLTKPDTFTLDINNTQVTAPETTAAKPSKPLKQCK